MSTLEQYVYMTATEGPSPLLLALPGMWGVRNGLLRKIQQDTFVANDRNAFTPNGQLIYQQTGSSWNKFSLRGSTVTLLGTNAYGPGDPVTDPANRPHIKTSIRSDGAIYVMAPTNQLSIYIYQINYAGLADTLLQTISRPGPAADRVIVGCQFSADGSKLVILCGFGGVNTFVYIKQVDGSYALQQSLSLPGAEFSKLAVHPSGTFITVAQSGNLTVNHVPFVGNSLNTGGITSQGSIPPAANNPILYSPDGTLLGTGQRVYTVSGMSLSLAATIPIAPGETTTQYPDDFSGDSQLYAFGRFIISKRGPGNTFTPLPSGADGA
jgi:DNA-binding beta-propeller fold protein YncE